MKKSTIALNSSTLKSLKEVKEIYSYNSYDELLSFLLDFILLSRISKEDLLKLNVLNEIKLAHLNDFERIIKIIKNIEKNLLIPTNNTVQKLNISSNVSNEIVEDNSKVTQLERQLKLKDDLINNLNIDLKIKEEKIIIYTKMYNMINSSIEKEDDLFSKTKNYIIKVPIEEFDKVNIL